MALNNVELIMLAMVTGGLITYFFITLKISLARLKGIIDIPDNGRKIHHDKTPTLGGIAIFGGVLIGLSLWISPHTPGYFPYMIASLMILFATGLKDDILLVSARKKLIAQTIAAASIVIGGNIRLHHFEGFLGLEEAVGISGIVFTIFAIVVIINAFNFIDGIDGLAGSIALVGSVVFGIWFYLNGHFAEAILSFALAGSLAGFLYHNFEPAKIFMGDTGALIVGFIMAVLAFKMISLNEASNSISLHRPSGLAFSILIVPMFDTLRVIIIRLLNGQSPLKADSRHLHHCMLRMGFRHRQIALILSAFTLIIVFISILINNWPLHYYLLAVIFIASLILPTLWLIKRFIRLRRQKNLGKLFSANAFINELIKPCMFEEGNKKEII
ncbi:MAG: hypothetical protein U1C46_00615 [Bacteroidales bacterium]|nr:hypothetical protein [Bacteroidales bacterium]